MLRITIACVGKIRESYLSEGIREYQKRLGRYCRFEIVQVADETVPEGLSENGADRIREKEGERLLKKIPDSAYVIALDLRGKSYDSPGFAERIDRLASGGRSHLVFVIGGSIGLSGNVLQRADESVSFSRMTFPHQLMRLILCEQIYRAFRIINHEPYHK